jgi:hypothetical protein
VSAQGQETPSGTEQALNGKDTQGYLLLHGLIIPLPKEKETVIGRDNDKCDVVLVNERISKAHSIITYYNGRYFIEDAGSLNGTFVNGQRITKKTPLVAGDKIRLRPYEILFAGADHPQVANSNQPVLLSNASKHAGHFSGKLKVVPLTDLIQLLNSTQQSGVLTIQDARGQRGKLIFVDGEIAAATYGSKMAEEAVYGVLAVKSGKFDFLPCTPPPVPSPITKKTMSLLLEGCRLIDEDMPGVTETIPVKGQKTRKLPRLEL